MLLARFLLLLARFLLLLVCLSGACLWAGARGSGCLVCLWVGLLDAPVGGAAGLLDAPVGWAAWCARGRRPAREIATREPDGSELSISKPGQAPPAATLNISAYDLRQHFLFYPQCAK